MKTSGMVVWIALVLVYTALTFVLSSIQASSLYPPFQIYRIDLLLHALEYGFLAWLLLGVMRSFGRIGTWQRFAIIMVYCGIIGGLNELWQSRVPGRFPSLSDMLANIVGAVVILFIFRVRKYGK